MIIETVLMDKIAIDRTLTRIAHQILEQNRNIDNCGFIGMQTRGYPLAQRLAQKMGNIEKKMLPVGMLDVSLYRDDYRLAFKHTQIKTTSIPFDINNRDILLVDDVLYTGRSVRAALDALMDLGRPRSVRLIVLVDRGHHELPIRADYIGLKMTTLPSQEVSLQIDEIDGNTALLLINREEMTDGSTH